MKPIDIEFLRESNNIENEFGDKSLEDALNAWGFLWEQTGFPFGFKLTSKLVKEVHQMLMKSRTTIDKMEKGTYRNGPVWIGGHEAKSWFVVPELMEQWLVNVNDVVVNGQNENPIFLNRITKQHHVQFEAIHPFFDGNGRLGRILWNWERVNVGLPIKVIHTGKEQFAYYDWFK